MTTLVSFKKQIYCPCLQSAGMFAVQHETPWEQHELSFITQHSSSMLEFIDQNKTNCRNKQHGEGWDENQCNISVKTTSINKNTHTISSALNPTDAHKHGKCLFY